MSIIFRPYLLFSLSILLLCNCSSPRSEEEKQPKVFSVIAYYHGDSLAYKNYPTEKLTHIIFSFLHLKGQRLAFDKPEDSITVKHLVALKEKQAGLKVLLSLGGWGGCETCPDVFSTEEGRNTFAESVKAIVLRTHTDGIDLDWEYPAIVGLPEHKYMPADRHNFTLLVQALRKVLGDQYEITFAAGGYTEYLEKSIEWKEVMQVVDRVNVMSYDLTNGYSTTTGHHTPLYSTPQQVESTDHAVRFLDSIGVPAEKIIIGAAFYARIFDQVPAVNQGLNQSCKFKTAVTYKDFQDSLFTPPTSFTEYWDTTAQAPYAYHTAKKEFATYDNEKSIALKTKYAFDHKLGGIMFWELKGDKKSDGLLNVIDNVVKQHQ
jgi:chitinase